MSPPRRSSKRSSERRASPTDTSLVPVTPQPSASSTYTSASGTTAPQTSYSPTPTATSPQTNYSCTSATRTPKTSSHRASSSHASPGGGHAPAIAQIPYRPAPSPPAPDVNAGAIVRYQPPPSNQKRKPATLEEALQALEAQEKDPIVLRYRLAEFMYAKDDPRKPSVPAPEWPAQPPWTQQPYVPRLQWCDDFSDFFTTIEHGGESDHFLKNQCGSCFEFTVWESGRGGGYWPSRDPRYKGLCGVRTYTQCIRQAQELIAAYGATGWLGKAAFRADRYKM